MGRPNSFKVPDLTQASKAYIAKDEEKRAVMMERVAVLKKLFETNILAYAEFVFPHHCSVATPEFHKELYALYMDFSKKKIAIAAPRGHAKSTVTNLIFLSWVIAYSKAHFIFIISNTLTQSKLHLETLKSEIAYNENFKTLYGILRTDKWAAEDIQLKNKIKIFARGSGQQIRGLKYLNYRPDLIILDDLEDDELVQSADRRVGLQRWLHSEVYPALDVNVGRILYIGTILHYDSLLNKIISPSKDDAYIEWERRIYKAMLEDGKALWPEHLSYKDLEKIRDESINSGVGHLFYSEYQNEPRDSETQFFKRDDWRYWEDGDLSGKLLNTFTTCDLAVSRSKQADYSVIVTVSIDTAGNYYIREIRRGRWSPKEIVDQIFLAYEKFRPQKVGVEDGIEWQTLRPYVDEEVLRRRIYLPLEELKHMGMSKKESPTRIRGLDPLYRTHCMFHRADDENTRYLEEELFRFPSAKHDDVIDALAYILHISKIPGEENNEYADNGFTAYGKI